MGRVMDSYTEAIEEVIRLIKGMRKYMDEDDRRAVDRMIKAIRRAQGPLYFDYIQDYWVLAMISTLIDIYRRLEWIERCISRGGSSRRG